MVAYRDQGTAPPHLTSPPLRGGEESHRAERASLLLQRRELVDERAEGGGGIELVAEVELVAMRPDLELLVDRDGTDLLNELVLRLLPEHLLLGGVGLGAGCIDLLVGDGAVREIGHRRRRGDDTARVKELSEIDVGNR